jgi:hypothetical protein
MSMRQTEEMAEEASRFSIRSLFPMSMTMRAQVSEAPYATLQPQPQPQPQPQLQPQLQPQPQIQAAPPQLSSRTQLRFNLPIQQTPAGLVQQQHDPFKFALAAAGHDPAPAAVAPSVSTPEFRPTTLKSINAASAGSSASGVSNPVGAHATGGVSSMTVARTMPIEAHEAEIARIAVTNNELTERLKLSESKLVRTEASVVRGNQALATERVQYKQKIISLSEEMDTLRANEKRAVEELELRADESMELSKLKLEMKTIEEKHKSVTEASASEYALLSGDYMELSGAKDALQREATAYIKSIDEKEAVINTMAVELEVTKRTAASAEAQIDELDAKLAKLRVEEIFEPSDATAGHCGSAHVQKEEEEEGKEGEKEEEKDQQPRTFKPSAEAVKETLDNEFGEPTATGQVFPTGDELRKEVTEYIMKNYKSFPMDYFHPGDRVMDRRTGRLATVMPNDEEGMKELVTLHPRVRYDDDPSVVYKSGHKAKFIKVVDEESLPPFPWVAPYGIAWGSTSASVEPAEASSAWTITQREAEVEAEAVAVAATPAASTTPMIVRFSTCCSDEHETSKQLMEEEAAKAARVHLAKNMHKRFCTMGVHRVDGPLSPDLHAYEQTGNPSDALRAAQIANPAENTDAAVRTATYVAAVSEDIKKRMTGQREQWAKAVQIGAAA